MFKVKDLTGKHFDMLQVIEYCGIANNGYASWKCICDCENIVYRTTDVLKRKTRHSCGCLNTLNLKNMKRKNTTHGMTNTRLYRIYKGMRERCYNPKSQRYNCYGARGIVICDEWLNDRSKFFSWALRHGYREDLTIERINVNGNYCPQNCKWIPMSEQYKNKQSNHITLPEPYKEADNDRKN